MTHRFPDGGYEGHADAALNIDPVFTRPGEATSMPKYQFPEELMQSDTAYQIVHDAAMLDGNARLNLATFVSTWMDENAQKLYAQVADKNMVDKDEYPATAELEERCWRMLADLWHIADADDTIGTSTVSSSEACMLGGLALKRLWQERRLASGLPADRPNLVLSAGVQVVWEKFCNYWEVEARYVPISEEHLGLDGSDLEQYVDEHTIGVVAILGQTYTGIYEPVQEIAAKLDEIERDRGIDVRIHVDGASGAMVAPFCQPELVWDFRIDRVNSVSTSGHKYGLVYPGVGWVVWRDRAACPESLIFHVSYLGGDLPTLGLNFSRPGAQVLLQYYQFLRLGFAGYRRIQQNSLDVAQYLSGAIADMGPFALVTAGDTIPVFAWRLVEGSSRNWNLYDLADRLRMRGWLVPAYPLPEHLTEVVVQRIVVRAGLSRDLAGYLLDTIREEVSFLESLDAPMPRRAGGGGFAH